MQDLLIKLSSAVKSISTDKSHLLSINDSIVNVKFISERNLLIERLTAETAKLASLLEEMNAVLDTAKTCHSKDMHLIGSVINSTKKEEPWSLPRKSRLGALHMGNGAAITHNKPAQLTAQPAQTNIKFTEALSLTVLSVDSFDLVKQDGSMYFVTSAAHFAVRINGLLFHGNIGTIYTDEKNPEKIKDCRYSETCMKRDNCDYYHDPVKFAGSKDCRNFIASSWLYSPPDSFYKNRSRSRRFGSREHIDVDIVGLQDEERVRFYDQTMHDILCSLLLKQSYEK